MTFAARSQTVRSESDIVFALSKLREDAGALGFDDYDLSRTVTAASELAHNILKYAGSGEISYSELVDGTKHGVKLVASDEGPGIADLKQALVDSYSSSGTLGLGLAGVKRLVDDFDVVSQVGIGTTVAFKVWGS